MISQTTTDLNKQPKQILNLLAKYRFITVQQFQQLLHHKSNSKINAWLVQLVNQKYIARIKNEKDVTKPIVYCLDQRSRKVLKEDENIDASFLLWLYKEKKKEDDFVNHCLSLLDIYLYFEKNKEAGSAIHFFSKHELKGYEYFPEKLPDAYIAVKTKNGTNRYFLELFDNYRGALGIPRFTLRKYIEYFEEGSWQLNTDNSDFPRVLFIFPTERRKMHIYYYGKAKLKSSSSDDLEIFLTTVDSMKFSKPGIDIWKKVE